MNHLSFLTPKSSNLQRRIYISRWSRLTTFAEFWMSSFLKSTWKTRHYHQNMDLMIISMRITLLIASKPWPAVSLNNTLQIWINQPFLWGNKQEEHKRDQDSLTRAPMREEKTTLASATSSTLNCFSSRVSGFNVVSQSCKGIISPKPAIFNAYK